MIISDSLESLYAAFEGDGPGRAEAEDIVILTVPVALNRDLVMDVPVTLKLHGVGTVIDSNGYRIRTSWRESCGAEARTLLIT